jgi:hypothetical protein
MMDSGIPRLAKLKAIFRIEIIRVFFNFEHFTNDTRGVIGNRGKNSSLAKTNEVFRIT